MTQEDKTTVITPIAFYSPQEALRALCQQLDVDLETAEPEDKRRVAVFLSRMAGRPDDRAWTHRYITNMLAGRLPITEEMAHAIQVGFSYLAHLPWATASRTLVYTLGQVEPNSVVMGSSRLCSAPDCGVVFVPTVPWGKRCPLHQRKRART